MPKLFARKKEDHSNLFLLMLVSSFAGLVSAFVLTVDKFRLLEDPDAVLSCSINIVLNCANVMQTTQASAFGFPNSLIGLMGFSVVMTVAVAFLSGARPNRLFWQVAQVVYALGAIFAYWLFFSSVYVIQVLCPWCLVVTFVTTLILASLTHYNLRENNFKLSKKAHKKALMLLDKGVLSFVTATWIVLLVALVLVKFGDGLFT